MGVFRGSWRRQLQPVVHADNGAAHFGCLHTIELQLKMFMVQMYGQSSYLSTSKELKSYFGNVRKLKYASDIKH